MEALDLLGRATGQLTALVNKIERDAGSNAVDRILADEARVVLEEVIRKLADKNGRCIPARDLSSAVCDPDRSFHSEQPEIDYDQRLERLKKFFPEGSVFLSAEDFCSQSRRLIEELKKDKSTANVLNGVYLPICLPKLEIVDYGHVLEEVFLSAVSSSYCEHFPDRQFYNHREGELTGAVSIVEGSRHEQLVDKMAKGPVVGIYFPNPLQGFSVHADREQIETLPEYFLLAGGLDTITAIVAYPEALTRDYQTPGLDLAALSWRSAERSLCVGAYDGKLGLDDTAYLAEAYDDDSGGLFFLR